MEDKNSKSDKNSICGQGIIVKEYAHQEDMNYPCRSSMEDCKKEI